MSYKYPWYVEALKFDGLKEVKGEGTNPTIAEWLKEAGATWSDEETPWCALFMHHCFFVCKIPTPKHWMRALSYGSEWGVNVAGPTEGAIAVFERVGGGHVGLVSGMTPDGKLLVYGGNQNNSVTTTAFDISPSSTSKLKLVGYYLPKGYLPYDNLPIITAATNKIQSVV